MTSPIALSTDQQHSGRLLEHTNTMASAALDSAPYNTMAVATADSNTLLARSTPPAPRRNRAPCILPV